MQEGRVRERARESEIEPVSDTSKQFYRDGKRKIESELWRGRH